jgi:hypothetical protein
MADSWEMSEIPNKNAHSATTSAGANQPFPEHENTPTETGKAPHATLPGRWADGTVRTGATGPSNPAFKNGRYMAPPATGAGAAESATEQLRSDLAADPAREAIRICEQRIIEHGAILNVIVKEGIVGGFLTPRGRPKSLINSYLAIAAQQDRLLARLIALHDRRKDANVLDLPLADYLRQQPEGGKA